MTGQNDVLEWRDAGGMYQRLIVPLLALVLALGSGARAEARDLLRLSDLLVPIFVAQQFGNLCAAQDSSFLNETGGTLGSINDYSEHAKFEVAHTLVAQEVTTVLQRAAQLAREAARQAVPRASSDEAIQRERSLTGFCNGPAKSVVRAAIAVHDSAHDRFLNDVQEGLE